MLQTAEQNKNKEKRRKKRKCIHVFSTIFWDDTPRFDLYIFFFSEMKCGICVSFHFRFNIRIIGASRVRPTQKQAKTGKVATGPILFYPDTQTERFL
jgi:hypothetical protein